MGWRPQVTIDGHQTRTLLTAELPSPSILAWTLLRERWKWENPFYTQFIPVKGNVGFAPWGYHRSSSPLYSQMRRKNLIKLWRWRFVSPKSVTYRKKNKSIRYSQHFRKALKNILQLATLKQCLRHHCAVANERFHKCTRNYEDSIILFYAHINAGLGHLFRLKVRNNVKRFWPLSL